MSHPAVPRRPWTTQRIVMRERPDGPLELRHFDRREERLRELQENEVLVENVLLSVAPAARAVMQTDTYRPRLDPGELIPSTVIGRVIRTSDDELPVGSLVAGFGGWEEYSILPSAGSRVLTVAAPLEQYLSVLGQNGLTAYFGLVRIGEVSPGDTVVVSGAAGGVGHLAGQIARALGARVVGITGSDEKNRVLTERLGFDAAVDRRSATFGDDLRAAAPDGVDVYFDNVAGPVTDTVLPLMNRHGRVVLCGATSSYETGAHLAPGPAGLALTAIARSLRLEGFLVADFRDEWVEATEVLRGWTLEGRIVPMEEISDGLDSAPPALLRLLTGRSTGQSGVRLRPDPVGLFA
jgi:NADPH-dependent curcumin reductase CurA